MKRAVTIQDIAKQLNISRNTVAKALNGQYVPEKTRLAVLNKAREMNYKSMSTSRIEVGKKRYRILLISGKPLNNINYFIPLIKGIENICYERNYELFQYTFNDVKQPFKELSDYIDNLKIDGIIAIECFNKDFICKLLNLGIPICFNDFSASEINSDKNYDIISADDRYSIYRIVKLLHLKYKITKFTFVGDNKHCLSFRERYDGMLTALLSARCPHMRSDDILRSDAAFSYGSLESIKAEILQLKNRPECYICCNDFVARNVCNALEVIGTPVPKQTLVVGFDNVAEAVAKEPFITTFSVDKEFMGEETVRMLISRIENPAAPKKTITVSSSLKLRRSTERYLT